MLISGFFRIKTGFILSEQYPPGISLVNIRIFFRYIRIFGTRDSIPLFFALILLDFALLAGSFNTLLNPTKFIVSSKQVLYVECSPQEGIWPIFEIVS